MLCSCLYRNLPALPQLVVLLARSQRAKELQILLLRHSLALLRRETGRLELRYPEIHVAVADSRRFAEEWTSASLADATDPSPTT